jgi:hypothetical protein
VLSKKSQPPQEEPSSPLLPPAGLSPLALEIWEDETATRTRSRGRLALLGQCLRAFDEANRFAALLKNEPPVTVSKRTGMHHISPLVKAEKECRMVFAQLAKILGLEWDPDQDGDGIQALSPYGHYLRQRRQEARQEHQENGREG